MTAVTILLVVLIGGINVFNYLTTSGDNDRLMEMLCYNFETSTMWNGYSASDNNQPPQNLSGVGQNTVTGTDTSGSQDNPTIRTMPIFNRRRIMEQSRPTTKRTAISASMTKTQ